MRAFQHIRRFARPLQSVLGLLQPLARLCRVGMMHSPTDRARFPFLQVYGQSRCSILIHQLLYLFQQARQQGNLLLCVLYVCIPIGQLAVRRFQTRLRLCPLLFQQSHPLRMFRPLFLKRLPLERMFPQVAQALLFLCQLRQLGPVALRQGKLRLGRLAFGLRFYQTLLRRRMCLPFCEQLLLRCLMRREIGVYPRGTAGLGAKRRRFSFHFFLLRSPTSCAGVSLLLQGSKALRKVPLPLAKLHFRFGMPFPRPPAPPWPEPTVRAGRPPSLQGVEGSLPLPVPKWSALPPRSSPACLPSAAAISFKLRAARSQRPVAKSVWNICALSRELDRSSFKKSPCGNTMTWENCSQVRPKISSAFSRTRDSAPESRSSHSPPSIR